MRLKTGDFVYQSEYSTDHHGNRWQRIWRRRVLACTEDRVALGGAEVLTVPLDFPGDMDWLPCEGMLGMDVSLPWERFTERGYSTSFRLGRGAA